MRPESVHRKLLKFGPAEQQTSAQSHASDVRSYVSIKAGAAEAQLPNCFFVGK